jgi:peptidoglycan/LPS O-acetylase OafA/YrhL
MIYAVFKENKFWESMEFFTHFRQYQGKHDPFANIFWTIPIEIQFYFILPFLVFIFWNFNRLWQSILIIISTFYLFNYYYYNIKTSYSYYDFGQWLVFFLYGYAIAILYIKLEQYKILEFLNSYRIFNYTICFLTYVMFIDGHRFYYIYSSYLAKYKFGNEYGMWGVYWSFYLFLMLIGDPNHFTKFLNESKILQGFGEYSYGVYLINIYAMHLNEKKVYGRSFNGLLFICAFCYWFSFLFYHLIEKPMIRLANFVISKLQNSNYQPLHISYYTEQFLNLKKYSVDYIKQFFK